jgi:hypothetical protein
MSAAGAVNGNGAGHSSSSKAADLEAAGFQAQKKMKVEPPKGEDLQQSYAAVVGTESVTPAGWYGGMSMLHLDPPYLWRCLYSNPLLL